MHYPCRYKLYGTQSGWNLDFINVMHFLLLKYSHHPLFACHFPAYACSLQPLIQHWPLSLSHLGIRGIYLLHLGDKNGIQCPFHLPQVISLAHVPVHSSIVVVRKFQGDCCCTIHKVFATPGSQMTASSTDWFSCGTGLYSILFCQYCICYMIHCILWAITLLCLLIHGSIALNVGRSKLTLANYCLQLRDQSSCSLDAFHGYCYNIVNSAGPKLLLYTWEQVHFLERGGV